MQNNLLRHLGGAGLFGAVLVGLLLTLEYSFILFHTMAELFSIAVAFTLFIIFWNTRKLTKGSYFTIIGIAFGAIGLIDLLHTLAYKGMGVFEGYGANLPTQLWILARYIQAVTFLAAPLLMFKRLQTGPVLFIYVTVLAAALVAIFQGHFPECYIEGAGLTTFKIASEYAISLLLIGSAGVHYIKRESFSKPVYGFLLGAVAFSVVSELTFTTYGSVYAFSNALGHILKIAAFYCIYRAFVAETLLKPFDLLFLEVKERERDLRESKTRFKAIADYTYDWEHWIDLEGRAAWINPAVERITGYSVQECMAMDDYPLRLFHPDDRGWVTEHFERALKGFRKNNLEFRVVTKQGRTLWVAASYQPIFDEKGEMMGHRTSLRDISDRKMVEQALQKSQEKYWKIFRSNPSFLLLSTLKEGKFLEINPAFEEITGYSRKELLDSSAFELNIWADWSQRERLVAKLLEQGSFTDEEMDLRTKSGDIRSVSISCEYMELDGERHIVMAGTDITERKQMEKALRDIADELEHRVRERTIELERANRAKDDFLANMSHELRTPLSGILGLTDVLLDHVPDQASRSDLSLIRYSADSALVLLNDILDLTRIEQGKIELHPLEFDLEEMVSNIARPFEIQAQEKGLGFDVVVDETLPDRFRGDPDRLGQVLKNLLSNAVKFTKSGSVRLMIDKEGETDHLARIRFTVADTGIGIPEGKKEVIFQAFSQLDTSYSKNFAGIGLGLAITKSLVELMEGDIQVTSEPGQGTSFMVLIPLEKAAQKDVSGERQPTLSNLAPLSILLAEDNAVNQLFMRRTLTASGHSVTLAANGKEVLEKLSEKQFDCILMDIQMPEMDGIEATRLIRSGGNGYSTIPIIALTAYAMKGDREKFLKEGIDCYVSKPVDFGELARAIQVTVRWKGDDAGAPAS